MDYIANFSCKINIAKFREMCLILLFKLLGVLTCLAWCELSTRDQIKQTFGVHNCIEGSLSMLSTKSTETYLLVEDLNNDSTYSGNISTSKVQNEKSPMSKLHELAQYNEIKYVYRLEKEEGPPHNKLFTVSLKFGDEEFVSEGSTLKKAQHNVANIALENTDYAPSPFKEREHNTEALTPTVLLNNLGAKLGLQVTYFLMDKDKKMSHSNLVLEGNSKKSYLQKLNDSLYSDQDIHIRKDESQSSGPFKVMVEVGDAVFYGISYTVQSARHDAAAKAVDYLVKMLQEGNSVCINEETKECKEAKVSIKSPISMVYEAAQLRNIDVVFDIIKEEGPSHKKVFTTRCKLGDLETTGEGNSKKESKKDAAINMVGRLSELPEVPQEVMVKSLMKDKRRTKKKKNKIIKTNFDMINMHIDNFIESILDSVPMSGGDKLQPDHVKPSPTSKSSKKTFSGKSYQDKILEVSNLLKFEVQFLDIDDKEDHLSILSLYINPNHICLGSGLSTKAARNKAAQEGLKLLQDIPLESYFGNSKHAVIERDLKEKIYLLLNQDLSKEEL